MINLFHEMMITVNVYKIKTNNYGFHVVNALITGFTSLLKGW